MKYLKLVIKKNRQLFLIVLITSNLFFILNFGMAQTQVPDYKDYNGNDSSINALKTIFSYISPEYLNTITIVGNSLAQGYFTTDENSIWFYKFLNIINNALGNGSTRDGKTNFGDSRYLAFTYGGPLSFTNQNPASSALVMNQAGWLQINGNYDYFDLTTINTAPSIIQFSLNGVVYRTLNIPAGIHYTFDSSAHTGSKSNNDILRITCTSGVTIVGVANATGNFLQPNNLVYQNNGHSGWGIQDVLNAYQYSSTQHGLKGDEPNIIINEIGINNMVNPSLYLDPHQLARKMDTLLTMYELQPKTKVIGIFPANSYGPSYPMLSPYKSYHDSLIAVYSKHSMPCLDLSYNNLGQMGYLNTADGLHYNDAGAKFVAGLLVKFLANLSKSPTSQDSSLLVIGNNIRYYPNPATSQLIINNLYLTDHWQTISVANVLGQRNIITQNISGKTQSTINVERLENGIYIATLVNDKGYTTHFEFVKE